MTRVFACCEAINYVLRVETEVDTKHQNFVHSLLDFLHAFWSFVKSNNQLIQTNLVHKSKGYTLLVIMFHIINVYQVYYFTNTLWKTTHT